MKIYQKYCQNRSIYKYNLIFVFITIFSQLVGAQNNKAIDSDTLKKELLLDKTISIHEVEVNSRMKDYNIKSGSTGLLLDVKQLKQLPKFLGENDLYKAIQYMGGVSQAGEGNAGLYVRGGNNDQNLVQLNGAIIQNPTHVLGMFSVFNSDLIGQIRFIKSGIPAEYGGRLSSIIDISTLSGIPDKIKVDGSIGLISSRISTQIPLSKQFSIFGAWRGSYISKIILPALKIIGVDSALTQNSYEFWDANAGFNYQLNSKSKFSGHIYLGSDDITIKNRTIYGTSDNETSWQNKAIGVQFNHIFNDSFSLNQQLNYSHFNADASVKLYDSYLKLQSQSEIMSFKTDFFQVFRNQQLKYGAEVSLTKIKPNYLYADSVMPLVSNIERNELNSTQLTFYFRDEWNYGNLLLNIGLRANLYVHIGRYNDFVDNTHISYSNAEIIKTYSGIEPRFFARYLINAQSSLKLSATRHIQYLNKIPVLSIGVPADIQIPASLYVKPQASWHFSTGYFLNFDENNWELGLETYYKTLENQLEFKNNIENTLLSNQIDKELLAGRGWTYGGELKLSKNLGKFTGWICYNLAWNYRQFEKINNGISFLAQNDRRHDISIVGMYELNKKWSFSSVFVYATGSRLNLPLSWFIIDGMAIMEYGKYNAFKMPDYHRLDISANYKMKSWHGIRSDLNFSIYNAYNRANPFQVLFTTNKNERYSYYLKMTYLLPIIPSVSWTFHL